MLIQQACTCRRCEGLAYGMRCDICQWPLIAFHSYDDAMRVATLMEWTVGLEVDPPIDEQGTAIVDLCPACTVNVKRHAEAAATH